MGEGNTSIPTRPSLPLAQFWGGRLQLGSGTPQDVRNQGQSFLGAQRAVHLSGFGLSFHFGRDARAEHPADLWRNLSRIVSGGLN